MIPATSLDQRLMTNFVALSSDQQVADLRDSLLL
jgi:hypothetical protein